jgi:quinol monooxygenase YgiN
VPTVVIVSFATKPDWLSSFWKIMQGVKQDLPNVPGCQSVQVYNDVSNPCAFTLVETWSSAEAHKTHLNRLLLSGAWGQIVSHLAKEPVSGFFSAI